MMIDLDRMGIPTHHVMYAFLLFLFGCFFVFFFYYDCPLHAIRNAIYVQDISKR